MKILFNWFQKSLISVLILILSLIVYMPLRQVRALTDDPNDPLLVDSSPDDVIPPANVTNFKAEGLDKQIQLGWTNPTDVDFVRTVIVRKTGSASTSRLDGIIIYEGTDTVFTDIRLTNETTYYYTAYTFDYVPNYSSGISVSASPLNGKIQTDTPVITGNNSGNVLINAPNNPSGNGGLTNPAGVSLPVENLHSGGGLSGSLAEDQGTIYFLSGNFKIPIVSMQVFRGLGYQLKNVSKSDLSGYDLPETYILNSSNMEHPWGSWLLSGKTVYYSIETGMIPVPSWDVFVNNGGKSQYIVKANRFDLSVLKTNKILPVMVENDSRIIK